MERLIARCVHIIEWFMLVAVSLYVTKMRHAATIHEWVELVVIGIVGAGLVVYLSVTRKQLMNAIMTDEIKLAGAQATLDALGEAMERSKSTGPITDTTIVKEVVEKSEKR